MLTAVRRVTIPALFGTLALGGLAFAGCSESADEDAEARAVYYAVLTLDNAGLHGMDESVNEDGEIPSGALSTMLELQTVIGLTPWPEEFEDDAEALSGTFGKAAGLLAVESPNLADVGAALTAAHDEEHEFAHGVWEWLHAEAGVEAPTAPEPQAVATIGNISLFSPSVKFTLGDTAAAYVLVRNSGEADRIVSAQASIKGMVELHEVVTEGATSKMQKVDGIDVPANGEVELKTGSYHVMMMNVSPEMETGDEVTVTLKFEKAGEVSFTVKAEQRAADSSSGDMHGHASPTAMPAR